MTCFRPRKCLLGVRTMGDVIWGKYSPKISKKEAWIGSFKPKRQNLYIAISGTINPTNYSDLRSEFRPRKALRHSWVFRHYPTANTTWLTFAILKIDMMSYFSGGCSDLDEIRQPDAEWYANAANYDEMVEIETGSRIPIWRTFLFRNRM